MTANDDRTVAYPLAVGWVSRCHHRKRRRRVTTAPACHSTPTENQNYETCAWFGELAPGKARSGEKAQLTSVSEQFEPRLNAAYSRAHRNWLRARKELAKVQAARVAHGISCAQGIQKIATASPLADLSRVPALRRSKHMAKHALDLYENGKIEADIFNTIRELENK